MKRLLIALKTRPRIDSPKYLGMYKFTVALPSLFTPDGSFYKTTDKADVTVELRKLQGNDQLNEVVDTDTSTSSRKVVSIDGIAFANPVDIQKFQIKNCSDFAECFLNIVKAETRGNNEARTSLESYDPKSLKANARANRSSDKWILLAHFYTLPS